MGYVDFEFSLFFFVAISEVENHFARLRQELDQRESLMMKQLQQHRHDKLKQLESISSHLMIMSEWAQSILRQSIPLVNETPFTGKVDSEETKTLDSVKYLQQATSLLSRTAPLIQQWNETSVDWDKLKATLGSHQVNLHEDTDASLLLLVSGIESFPSIVMDQCSVSLVGNVPRRLGHTQRNSHPP